MRTPLRGYGTVAAASGNRLLDAFPPHVLLAVRPSLRPATFRAGHEIPRNDRAGRALIHFPSAGLIAEMVSSAEGEAVELGLAGVEGFAPFDAVWGRPSFERPLVALSDTETFTIDVDALKGDRRSSFPIWATLTSYAFAAVEESMLGLLCNARHSALQRLARLLLRVGDREGARGIELSHDMLAQMLGLRRATITTALHSLAVMRAVQLNRLRVSVIDRAQLEAAACSCYVRARLGDRDIADRR
jgi:CRP-like cAMP-binding protein